MKKNEEKITPTLINCSETKCFIKETLVGVGRSLLWRRLAGCSGDGNAGGGKSEVLRISIP